MRARFTDPLGFNWEVDEFVAGGVYASQLVGEGELEYQWFPDSDLIAMDVNPKKLMELDMKLYRQTWVTDLATTDPDTTSAAVKSAKNAQRGTNK